MSLRNLIVPILAALVATGVQAQSSLSLDFQGTGGTTAPGFLAFEEANQALPSAGGTDYTVFGTTVNVALGVANLPDGAPDFRAVARNGAADETANDWLGVDTRNGGMDVTMDVIVTGLPAGDYLWVSEHHDGGSGATNGNLNGGADAMFTDGSTALTFLQPLSSQNNGEPISTVSQVFTSDGTSPVSLSLMMDFGQGLDAGDIDTGNHLFAFTNSLVISQVPEPGSMILLVFGLLGLGVFRRR